MQDWGLLDRFEKTSFASNTFGSLAVKRGPRLRCSHRPNEKKSFPDPPLGAPQSSSHSAFRPNVFPLHDVRYRVKSRQRRDPPSRSIPIVAKDKPLTTFKNKRNHYFIGPRQAGQKPKERATGKRHLKTIDVWWSQTGSNRRPHACKARALPTELWPQAGNVQAASTQSSQSERRNAARTAQKANANGGPGRT